MTLLTIDDVEPRSPPPWMISPGFSLAAAMRSSKVL
jgi:hypothetical protein